MSEDHNHHKEHTIKMALIPERIFEKFILTESATFLSLQGVSDPEMDQHFQTINSSQSSQSQTPMLGEALRDGSPPQFETLQNCQPPAHHAYQNEDSQQSNFEVGYFGILQRLEYGKY